MTAAWDSHRPPAPELIRDCVHCGFCLPTCPSYAVFGDEMDSPRGRILMMQVGHEPGSEISAPMLQAFDHCLGCMACVTSCPSGVQYDRLIEAVRPQLERNGPRTRADRWWRRLIFAIFTHPGRLRALVPLLWLQRRLKVDRMLARAPLGRFRPMLTLAPAVPLRAAVAQLDQVTPAAAGVSPHGTVALLQGCIQRVLFGDVNAATVRVLAAEGWEVHAPRAPRCCGALQSHGGAERAAVRQAKATIAAYEKYDVVAVNVAGCGSAMKEYGHLLSDEAGWADRATAFVAKVRDVHELLAEHPAQARRHPIEASVAYHDACHLAHAQGVRAQPRDLLRSIPGLSLIEPAGWELCCGSAGIYNLTQPDAAATLGARKAANLTATGAAAIAAANPGCALQIAAHLERPVPILHPVTLLDASLRGVRPPGL
jgi:glycolate oxidase iron-sulfur subunit